MKYHWIIALCVIMLYIHLFNAVAKWYLDSGRTLTLHDIWRKFAPPVKVSIEI